MESVGLAVGVAGLVGTFTACLDIVDRIDSYKDYGIDSRAVISQFDADRLLFCQWGNAVGLGLDDGALRDGYHARLDDPKVRSVVQGILNSIKEIAGDPTAQAGQIGSKDRARTCGALFERFRENDSHRTKLGWTMHKARFHALAQQVSYGGNEGPPRLQADIKSVRGLGRQTARSGTTGEPSLLCTHSSRSQ